MNSWFLLVQKVRKYIFIDNDKIHKFSKKNNQNSIKIKKRDQLINITIGFYHTIVLTQQRDTSDAFPEVFFCCNVNSTNRSIHLFDKHETVNIVYKTLKNIKGCDMCDICYPFGVGLLMKKNTFQIVIQTYSN